MKKVTLQWYSSNIKETLLMLLSLNKGEYLIVTYWNVGDGYAYGYK